MEVLGISIGRPAICPPTIVMTMLFLMIKLLECLWVMEGMDLGLKRPDNIPIVIMEFIVVLIEVVTMKELDIGLKRLATPPIEIMDKELMLMGELDIDLRPSTITHITQVAMANCWVYNFLFSLLTNIFMMVRYLDICFILATIPPVTRWAW